MLTVFSEQERLHAPVLQVETWIGDPQGLSFQGKVTLLDFWDYSCINCLNTLPFIRKWHEHYQAYGLQIIGLHAPEFSFAKETKTVQQAVQQLGVTYPVGLDNQFLTWQAYTNRGWPTQYVIDPNGYLKACNRGEGNAHALETLLRDELEKLNESVLSLPYVTTLDDDDTPISCTRLTPELYLGKARGRFANIQDKQGVSQLIETNSPLSVTKADTIYISGQWQWEREYLESNPAGNPSVLQLNCKASRILAVMQSEVPAKIVYRVDGSISGWRWVHQANCYPLITFDQVGEHHLEIWCNTPGVKFYTLLFQP